VRAAGVAAPTVAKMMPKPATSARHTIHGISAAAL
jgi:hypothetical protein